MSISSAMCSECFHFGKLTKAGTMYRHGHKMLVLNKTWNGFTFYAGYENEEIKQSCVGSGKPPRKTLDKLPTTYYNARMNLRKI